MLNLTYEGRQYVDFTPEQLIAAGVPEQLVEDTLNGMLAAEASAAVLSLLDQVYTRSPTLDAIYGEKYKEALAYKAAGYPANVSASEYPFLVREAADRELTKHQQADAVIAKGAAFREIAVDGESLRARLPGMIAEAVGHEAKRAVIETALSDLKSDIEGVL